MPIKGGQLATGTVTTTQILDGTIATADIAASAITGTLLATGSVTQPKIAADVVGNRYEERYVALVTTTNGQAMSATGLGFTPAGDSLPGLAINGVFDYTASYSAKTGDYYWSSDGGTTAKALASLAAGDIPYSGTKVTSYCASLLITDEITFTYSKSVT